MFISKKHGSFTLIGSILLNKKLSMPEGKLDTDHCGQCTRCIDNCPTSAIDPETRTIISKDCISTFTIEEFKLETISSEKMDLNSGYIFGCDICQNVCPWNLRLERNSKIEKTIFNQEQLELVNYLLVPPVTELQKSIEALSNNNYIQKFKNTSFERSGKRGVLKNLIFYLKNKR
jgi:epoxyqueuosine reductase